MQQFPVFCSFFVDEYVVVIGLGARAGVIGVTKEVTGAEIGVFFGIGFDFDSINISSLSENEERTPFVNLMF